MALGYPKLYNAVNPFDWMEQISLQVRAPPLCAAGGGVKTRRAGRGQLGLHEATLGTAAWL